MKLKAGESLWTLPITHPNLSTLAPIYFNTALKSKNARGALGKAEGELQDSI